MADEVRNVPKNPAPKPARYSFAPAVEGAQNPPAEGFGTVLTPVTLRLRSGAGITITYKGELVFMEIDLSTVSEAPPVTGSEDRYTLIWDASTGETWKVPAINGGVVPYHVHTQEDVENLIYDLSIRPIDAPSDDVIYGRQNGSWISVGGLVEWNAIQNKPDTFPPTLPIPISGVSDLEMELEEITGYLTQLDAEKLDAPAQWADIAGVPATFPAEPHSHEMEDVVGLEEELSYKLEDAPSDGKTYGRQNGAWQPAAGAAQIADTAPTVAEDNTFWWDSGGPGGGSLYIRYRDVDSVAWVQVGTQGAPGEPGPEGPQGEVGPQGPVGPASFPDAPVDGQQYVRQDAAWQPVDIAEGDYLPLAGGTLTGNLYIQPASGVAALFIDVVAGQPGVTQYQSAGAARWNVGLLDTTVESGGDVGSNFGIYGYSDDGSVQTSTFQIDRKTGAVIAGNGMWLNPQAIAANMTVPAGFNGMTAGPIIINDGVTVEVAPGSTWTVV